MCTAVSFTGNHHLFGRTLDLEHHYDETVTITPRHYPITTRHAGRLDKHYAIIGIATVMNDCPLYYDAANETGLCMAGLNFPRCACYHPVRDGAVNIASFELIPWILGQCQSVDEAVKLLMQMNITDTGFSADMQATALHWMLADRNRCVVIEPLADCLSVVENPVRVMTNSPTLDKHLFNLNNHMGIGTEPSANRFASSIGMSEYSRGMGGIGLPGDMSSSSRFVRAAFTLHNSVCGQSRQEQVVQFFRILGSVFQPRGCVKAGDGYVMSIYTSCCDADEGIYYFSTYENPSVYCVDMHHTDLDGMIPVSYPVFHPFEPLALN